VTVTVTQTDPGEQPSTQAPTDNSSDTGAPVNPDDPWAGLVVNPSQLNSVAGASVWVDQQSVLSYFEDARTLCITYPYADQWTESVGPISWTDDPTAASLFNEQGQTEASWGPVKQSDPEYGQILAIHPYASMVFTMSDGSQIKTWVGIPWSTKLQRVLKVTELDRCAYLFGHQ